MFTVDFNSYFIMKVVAVALKTEALLLFYFI